MKLEFGCGTKLTPGFLGVDVRKLHTVTYVCEAWNIEKHIKANSIEAIKSRHFLEHLTFFDVERTLQAWHNILMPDGCLMIEVPNMTFHAKQFLSDTRKTTMRTDLGQHRWNDETWSLKGFWGSQREVENGEIWDIHKSGYDFGLLEDLLTKHKFVDIQNKTVNVQNLYVECKK